MEGELESSKSLASANEAQSSHLFRRTANYQPSLWDDNYIQSLPDDSLGQISAPISFEEEAGNAPVVKDYDAFRDVTHKKQEIEMDISDVDLWKKLKEEARQLIDHNKQKDIVELLEYVDVLRQLGISYHFQSEIKNVLSFIASSLGSLSILFKNNLHGSALLFRLLREYDIKALRKDFFVQSFKNERGSFKGNILNDIKGMLSLYEASFLAIEDEDELDEAMEFTTKHLSYCLKKPLLIIPALVEQIRHALELPLHWRTPRLHTRWFIDAYERFENMNPRLLEFAKLDFNMLQSIYKKELKEMSRWWWSLGIIGDEFNFTRDRLMENYFWSLGCTFEPQFWRCRKEITKLGSLVTTIDDIYDVYGSIEELVLFTNAVDEWDISKFQLLPNYMKTTLMALINTVNDMAYDISIEKGLNILPQLKQAWGDQCKAYLVEARWYNIGYTPTLNEYLENGWLSIGVAMLLISTYCLSEDLTTEALNNLQFYSDATRYSSMVIRLYDDLATSKDEIQRGDVPKSIQCHMSEANVSESIAREHIRALLKRYWKLLNGEYISNFNVEESFKRSMINFPRTSQFIYQHGDGYGKPHHETKDGIMSLLIKPIP